MYVSDLTILRVSSSISSAYRYLLEFSVPNDFISYNHLGDSPNVILVNTAPYISRYEGKVMKSPTTDRRPVFTDEMNNCYVTGNLASGSRETSFAIFINNKSIQKKTYSQYTLISSLAFSFFQVFCLHLIVFKY